MTPIDTSGIPDSHIDIGGAAVPRSELRRVLPDIARFEAHLTDALAVESHMNHGDGAVPDFVQRWPEERLADVIATLKELGSIREQLTRNQAASPQPVSTAPDHSGSSH